ncbi:MAG TPA: hypothetical protein VN673_10850 [Clostridia bacterium]|nr:hypothetical protein [Clostridia bacterium]
MKRKDPRAIPREAENARKQDNEESNHELRAFSLLRFRLFLIIHDQPRYLWRMMMWRSSVGTSLI